MSRGQVCIAAAQPWAGTDCETAAERIQALVRRFLTHARLCDREVAALLAALKLWSKNNAQRLLERKDLGDWRVQVLIRTIVHISTTSRHPFKKFPYKLAYVRQLLRQLRAAQAASESLHARQRYEYSSTYFERSCMQREDKHEVLLNSFWRDQQRLARAEQARCAEKERLEYLESVRRRRHKHTENVVGKVTEEEANEKGERELMRLEHELQQRVVAWHKSVLQQRLDMDREVMRQEDLRARVRRDIATAEASHTRAVAVEAERISRLRCTVPAPREDSGAAAAAARGERAAPAEEQDTWRKPFALRQVLREDSLDALHSSQAFDHKAMRQLPLLELAHGGGGARMIDVLMTMRVGIDEGCYVAYKTVRALKAERRVRVQAHHTSSALLGCFESLLGQLAAVRRALRAEKIPTRAQRKLLLRQAERLELEMAGARSDLIFVLDSYLAAARREVWLFLQVLEQAAPPAVADTSGCVKCAAALIDGRDVLDYPALAPPRKAQLAPSSDEDGYATRLGRFDASADFAWIDAGGAASHPPLPPPRTCCSDGSSRRLGSPASPPKPIPRSVAAKAKAVARKDSKAASRDERMKAGLAKRIVDPRDRKSFQVPGVRSFLLESAVEYDFVRWARAARLWMSEVAGWFEEREAAWRRRHRTAVLCFLQRLELLLHGPAAAASDEQRDLQLLLRTRSESALNLMELLLSRGGLHMSAYDTRCQEEFSLSMSAAEADSFFGRLPLSLVARFLMERGLHGRERFSARATSAARRLSNVEAEAQLLLEDVRSRLRSRAPAYCSLDLRLPGELAGEQELRRALLQEVAQSAELFSRACAQAALYAASDRVSGRRILFYNCSPGAAGPLMFIAYDRARRDWHVPLWMQPAHVVENPRCGRGGRLLKVSSREQGAERAARALFVRLRFLAILRRNHARALQLSVERGTMEHEDALAAICRQRGYYHQPTRRLSPLESFKSLFRRHAKVSIVRYQEKHLAVLRSPWPDQLLPRRRAAVGWDTFDRKLLLLDEDGARRTAAAIHKRLQRRAQAMSSQSRWVSGGLGEQEDSARQHALRFAYRFKPDLKSVTLCGGLHGVVGLARVVEDVDSFLRIAPVAELLPPCPAIQQARTGFLALRAIDENSLRELAQVRLIDSNRKLSERSYATLHDGRVASEPTGAAVQRVMERDIWRCFRESRYAAAPLKLITKVQAVVRARIARRKVRALGESRDRGGGDRYRNMTISPALGQENWTASNGNNAPKTVNRAPSGMK